MNFRVTAPSNPASNSCDNPGKAGVRDGCHGSVGVRDKFIGVESDVGLVVQMPSCRMRFQPQALTQIKAVWKRPGTNKNS